jgi:hypothetical protein
MVGTATMRASMTGIVLVDSNCNLIARPASKVFVHTCLVVRLGDSRYQVLLMLILLISVSVWLPLLAHHACFAARLEPHGIKQHNASLMLSLRVSRGEDGGGMVTCCTSHATT